MKERYADTENVIESLREVSEWADGQDLDAGFEGRLTVVEAGRARVVAETKDDLLDRNLYPDYESVVDDIVCVIKWSPGGLDFLLLDLSFHEDSVESELCFTPAGHRAISPTQATSPLSLGEKLESALRPLERELNAMFTFKGVKAASMANGGHFTDFEYEYSIDAVRSL